MKKQRALELSDGGAVFDPREPDRYRYLLTRTWSEAKPAVFVMLNPSKATATEPDPTITRCIGFARAWGAGGLVVANLFALRSTDPDALLSDGNPIGPENDRYVVEAALGGSPVICAWGAHPMAEDRERHVLGLLRDARVELMCLRLTKEGRPGHPLFLPAGLRPIPLEAT